MKNKLAYYWHWLREGAVRVARAYPVEVLLALYACVGCLLTYELDWDNALEKLSLVPLFFALALALNILAGRGLWRRVYWVSWMPIIPLSLWGGLTAWVESVPYGISLAILCPLLLVVSRRAVRNDRFVNDLIAWLRSGALALLFINVALGLFYAILYSTTYIFGLEGPWIDHVAIWAVTICETLAVPVLFLMMVDRWRDEEYCGNRIIDMLLNYIVTPALLIYAAILYLYMAKILVTWSLPEGGVAYLIFGFTITALVVKAFQQLIEKRIYDWFFDRFSVVSLPMLVLFWVGVVRRTSEYGLTTARIYLVVCGVLMTLCIVLFLSQRFGRYLWVCLAAMVSFAALAYVPMLNPERIAVRSQLHRAERIARSLDRLDAQGRLLLVPLTQADTIHKSAYRELYESLEYIQRDSAAFNSFGIESIADYMAIMPRTMCNYVEFGPHRYRGPKDEQRIVIGLPENCWFEVDSAYSRYYTNIHSWSDGYTFANDTLRLRLGEDRSVVVEITGAELLENQVDKNGIILRYDESFTDEQIRKLLDYRSERYRILFEQLHIDYNDSIPVISHLEVNSVWVR